MTMTGGRTDGRKGGWEGYRMLSMWSWCRLSGLSVSLGVLLLDEMPRREGAY